MEKELAPVSKASANVQDWKWSALIPDLAPSCWD